MENLDPLDTEAAVERNKDAAAKARQLAKEEADDIKWLMKDRRGRRIVKRLLESAGVFKMTFNTNSMTMAFHEGRRSEGVLLLTKIHTHCFEQYNLMMTENRNA